MRLTDMDNEPVFIEPIMIESVRRVGHLTEIVTRMQDKLIVKEPLEAVIDSSCKGWKEHE